MLDVPHQVDLIEMLLELDSIFHLDLNASGVMPIIFAQAIMFVPSFLGGSIKNVDSQFMSTFGQLDGN